MLLLLAIVQTEDAPGLAKRLMDQGLRLTRISSTGGLLASGNEVILLGIEDEQVDLVLQSIHDTCKTRMQYISVAGAPEPTFFSFAPIEVEVGGGVVFGIPTERFVRLPGASSATGATEQPPVSTPAMSQTPVIPGESKHMKLVIAIVQGEDANQVINALLAANHRLTRINTTGGFLRRGNATLLIGVEDHQVDEVINLIQANCRLRTEPAPLEKGIPAFAATVFVVNASHFVRV